MQRLMSLLIVATAVRNLRPPHPRHHHHLRHHLLLHLRHLLFQLHPHPHPNPQSQNQKLLHRIQCLPFKKRVQWTDRASGNTSPQLHHRIHQPSSSRGKPTRSQAQRVDLNSNKRKRNRSPPTRETTTSALTIIMYACYQD